MCIFCEIAAGRVKAPVVWETERVTAVLDIDPIHEGHVLLLPKIHVDSITDLPDEYVTDLVALTRRLVKAYADLYGAPGYGVMQNGGASCSFGHFHFHVFPRWPGDGYDWIYPAGEKEVSEAVAKKLREKLQGDQAGDS